MCWLDLFSQFDMTIYHVPGICNIITNDLLCCPDLAIVVRSVESSLLTQIHEA